MRPFPFSTMTTVFERGRSATTTGAFCAGGRGGLHRCGNHALPRGELDPIGDVTRELPSADHEQEQELDRGDGPRGVGRSAPGADERVRS